jgi:hypothetical protein
VSMHAEALLGVGLFVSIVVFLVSASFLETFVSGPRRRRGPDREVPRGNERVGLMRPASVELPGILLREPSSIDRERNDLAV